MRQPALSRLTRFLLLTLPKLHRHGEWRQIGGSANLTRLPAQMITDADRRVRESSGSARSLRVAIRIVNTARASTAREYLLADGYSIDFEAVGRASYLRERSTPGQFADREKGRSRTRPFFIAWFPLFGGQWFLRPPFSIFRLKLSQSLLYRRRCCKRRILHSNIVPF